MNKYKIVYNGNATKYKGTSHIIDADNKREAVEKYYELYNNSDYFPQEDGSIWNQQGEEICDINDEQIEYDGGYFIAIEIPVISCKLVKDEISIFIALNGENINSFTHKLHLIDDIDNVKEDLDWIKERIDSLVNETKLDINDYELEEVKDKLEFYYGNCN